jgi:hypothetical protein
VKRCAPVESTPPRTRAAPMAPWCLKKKQRQRTIRQHVLSPYSYIKEGDEPEEILLQHSHGRYNAWLTPRVQSMQFHIGGNKCCCEFRVGSRASPATSDIVSDIMNLNTQMQGKTGKIVIIAKDQRSNMSDLALAFSQFLSATMGPSVARVSAPRTIPSLNKQPTMVVPVLVAFGNGTPLFWRNEFLQRSSAARIIDLLVPSIIRATRYIGFTGRGWKSRSPLCCTRRSS